MFLALLLETVFLEVDERSLPDEPSIGSQTENSTLLRSLVEIIPLISDVWEYSAILTASAKQSNHLQIAAISMKFPQELRSDVTIEPGQPLTGWAFKWDNPIVVQGTLGLDDPRLAYQASERATAAAAIPTHVHQRCNGVLYVGTRYVLADYGEPFNRAELRVLRVIADVIGETLERNRIRVDFENYSYDQIIRKPTITRHSWATLRDHVSTALSSVSQGSKSVLNDNENMHLTVVRNETYNQLRRKRPEIADWITQHILETCQEYFLKKGLGNPLIFPRQDTTLQEFVCFIPRILISDDQDRVLRNNLRELLSSLNLPFSYQDHFEVKSFVWSMPFRLKELQRRLRDDANPSRVVDQVTSEIVREVEEALMTLPRIEKGHDHESKGAYSLALDEYLAAHYMAPLNRYLIRHIAKTFAALGKLKDSTLWWEKLIAQDPAAKHLVRYSYVLAAQGRFEEAIASYARAFEYDPHNSQILIEWGDLLLLQQRIEDALLKYEAAVNLQTQNTPLVWLRIAEAYIAAGDLDQATMFAELVLRQQPDNQEARRIMLRILFEKSAV